MLALACTFRALPAHPEWVSAAAYYGRPAPGVAVAGDRWAILGGEEAGFVVDLAIPSVSAAVFDGAVKTISDDGELVCVRDEDVSRTHRRATGEVVAEIWGQFGANGYRFSTDGRYLLRWSRSGQISACDAFTGEELGRVGSVGVITGLQVDPTRAVLAVSTFDGLIRFWTVPGLAFAGEFRACEVGASALALDGLGNLATADNGRLRLWRAPLWQLVREWAVPPVLDGCLEFGVGGSVLVTGHVGGVSSWRTAEGARIWHRPVAKSGWFSGTLDSGGNGTIVLVDFRSCFEFIDAGSGSVLFRVDGGAVDAAPIRAVGALAGVGSNNHSGVLMFGEGQTSPIKILVPNTYPGLVRSDSGGTRLLCMDSTFVTLFDLTRGSNRRLQHRDGWQNAAFSPSGEFLAANTGRSTIAVYRFDTGLRIAEHRTTHAFTFGIDDSTLYTFAYGQGVIQERDAATGVVRRARLAPWLDVSSRLVYVRGSQTLVSYGNRYIYGIDEQTLAPRWSAFGSTDRCFADHRRGTVAYQLGNAGVVRNAASGAVTSVTRLQVPSLVHAYDPDRRQWLVRLGGAVVAIPEATP